MNGKLLSLFIFSCFLCGIHSTPLPLIVISLNGLTKDLLKYFPNVEGIHSESVYGDISGLAPMHAVPTSYSIATGVRPVVHGAVSNVYFDAKNGVLNRYNRNYFERNPKVKPIWSLRMKSYCYDWPGSDYGPSDKRCMVSNQLSKCEDHHY